MSNEDKRKKMESETIDISNGALFLMIRDLEREVKYLKNQIDEIRPMAENAHIHTMRIGGS